MNTDDDLIMISALQHFLFCSRQCALIHTEKVWEENYLTAAGRTLHEHVDRAGSETRKNVHLATALNLVSKKLGITGVADMVEFRKSGSSVNGEGVAFAVKLPKKSGWWMPFPIEYKHGSPKQHRADEVQLCAQALCLEEMLGVTIPNGALFYGETRRRAEVIFDEELRALTESGAVAMSDDARKTVLTAWQKKKQEEVVHPFLGEKIQIGLLPHLQALLLSRYLRGDLDAYPPYMVK